MAGRMVPLEEAARRLGVTRRRAQALVTSKQLAAEKLGQQWMVPVSAVSSFEHTRVGRRGRPLTQRGAWAEICALVERPVAGADLDRRRRRVRPRAEHRNLYVHPGVLASLRADPGIVLSGRDAAAEAGAPVDPGGEIDAYVRRSGADALVRGVRAREVLENANLLLHVVDDDVWPFERGQRYAAPWVAWLDLEDRQDRAAGTLLDRLLGGRIRA